MAWFGRFGRLAALALVVVALSGASTCVPTKPLGLSDHSTPEATLRTLGEALASRAPEAASGYLRCFADSSDFLTPAYRQNFDPADVAAFTGACACSAPSEWGFSQEEMFYFEFRNLRPNDAYAATFEPVPANPDPPPSLMRAVLHRHYRVLSTSPGGLTTTLAIGYADLTFARTRAGWIIARWDDHVDPAVGVSPVDPNMLTLGRRRLESTR